MDERELFAIEARANAATEGPWRWEDQYEDGGEGPYFRVHSESVFIDMRTGELADDTTPPDEITMDTIAIDLCEADARFVAHARADVPALIAEIRRLRVLVGE